MNSISENSADHLDVKIRPLVWVPSQASAVKTWFADSPIGRFTLSARFIEDKLKLLPPEVDGEAVEITCLDYEDGVEKAEMYLKKIVSRLIED